MEASSEHPIRRFEAGRLIAATDAVVTEERVELDINDGQLRMGLLCLPRDLEALAVGFLVGEGALRRREDLEGVEVVGAEKILVRGDFEAEVLESIHLRWTRGTGCGGGGTSQLVHLPSRRDLPPAVAVSPEDILELIRRFQGRGELWQRTGGVHACALAEGGTIRFFAEDVGRHNAFDKIAGMAFLAGANLGGGLVLTTGRLSAEIVAKAVACGAVVLVSRGAPTGLGIALARRFGVTLVGFARGRRLNVYTGFERVTSPDAAVE